MNGNYINCSINSGGLTATNAAWQYADKQGNMAIANLESQSIQLKFGELPTKFQVDSFKDVSTSIGHVLIDKDLNKDASWKWQFSKCDKWTNDPFTWNPTEDSVWTFSWEVGERLFVKINDLVVVNEVCDEIPSGITIWQIFDKETYTAPSVQFREPPQEDPVGHCTMIGSENTTVNIGQVFTLTCPTGSVVETPDRHASIDLICQEGGYFQPNLTKDDCSK